MSALTVYSAMKARTGTTDYFVVPMKAAEAAAHAHLTYYHPKPQSIEEAHRRDIDYAAAKKHLAPYLAQNKDRFFGAVIFAVKGLSPDCFSPLPEATTAKLPMAYKLEAQRMGFLTMRGAITMIPLDGQHRLKAVRFAIEGKDNTDEVIRGLRPDFSLASEDIAAILIPYDEEKARKIFTDIGRQAKPAGKNLITDDDDIIAVLSRMIANDTGIISPDLVKYTSNALGDKEGYFTTLAAIAECNVAILEANFPGKISRTEPVEDSSKRMLYENKVRETWKFLAANINLFTDALADKKKSGDDKRREIRSDYLLGKPVPQVCLIKAFARLTNLPKGKLSAEQAAAKLNAVDWRKDATDWDRVLMSGGKILHKNKSLATDILCYIAGEQLDDEQKAALLKTYRAAFPPEEQKDKQLPKRLS